GPIRLPKNSVVVDRIIVAQAATILIASADKTAMQIVGPASSGALVPVADGESGVTLMRQNGDGLHFSSHAAAPLLYDVASAESPSLLNRPSTRNLRIGQS